MPAAAVIPAPRAYTNVAAVEKLIVNPWAWGCRASGRSARAVSLFWTDANRKQQGLAPTSLFRRPPCPSIQTGSSPPPPPSENSGLANSRTLLTGVWGPQPTGTPIVQVLLPENKNVMYDAGATHVICVLELRLLLLAASCYCPGAQTVIENLSSSVSFTDPVGRHPLPDDEYLAGASYQVYEVRVSGWMVGYDFHSLCQAIYAKFAVLCVGLRAKPAGDMLLLNPMTFQHTFSDGDSVVLLCRSLAAVNAVLRGTCNGELGPRQLRRGEHRCLQQESEIIVQPCTLSGEVEGRDILSLESLPLWCLRVVIGSSEPASVVQEAPSWVRKHVVVIGMPPEVCPSAPVPCHCPVPLVEAEVQYLGDPPAPANQHKSVPARKVARGHPGASGGLAFILMITRARRASCAGPLPFERSPRSICVPHLRAPERARITAVMHLNCRNTVRIPQREMHGFPRLRGVCDRRDGARPRGGGANPRVPVRQLPHPPPLRGPPANG